MSRQSLSARGSAAARGAASTPSRVERTGMTLARKCDCGNHAAGGTCDACAEKKKRRVARFADRPVQGGDAAPPIVHDVLHTGGERLSDSVRAMMEPRFGADFSDVRLHTDETAAQSARAVSAHAYTAGSHIAFASGRYQPSTAEGQRLIAHELTHVVQQRGSGSMADAGGARDASGAAAGPTSGTASGLTIGHPADASEREADATADRVLQAQPSGDIAAPGSGVQRDLSDGAIGGIIAGAAGAVGAGFLIAWAAGAFDKEYFTTDELIAYLDELAATGAPKKKTISDNMARDVVRHWISGKDPKIDVSKGHQGKNKTLSPNELKRLLILEMLAGPTTGADEDQIIAIIDKTTPEELVDIFNPAKGLSVQDVDKDVDGDQHKTLMALLESKFPQGSEVRKQTPAEGTCNARDAMVIYQAKTLALSMVEHTLQMLATPGDPAVKAALDCYFKGASEPYLIQIRGTFEKIRDRLPTAKYGCVRGLDSAAFHFPGGGSRDVQCVAEDADALLMKDEFHADPALREVGRTVFLCDKFFERDFETQAGTVVHETAHRAGIDDHQYNPPCGYPLGTALDNSDSYAHFAAALFARRGAAASKPAAAPASAPASGPASAPTSAPGGATQGKSQ